MPQEESSWQVQHAFIRQPFGRRKRETVAAQREDHDKSARLVCFSVGVFSTAHIVAHYSRGKHIRGNHFGDVGCGDGRLVLTEVVEKKGRRPRWGTV